MKTKVRLTLALGALALLVFVLAAVSFATIWSLRGEGRGLLQANYTSIEYMQGMVAAIDGQGPAAADSLHALLAKQQANITEMGEDQATAELAIAVDAWTRTDGDSLSTALLRQRIARIVDLNKEAIVHRVAAAESKGENALVWIGLTGTFCALIALSMLFSIPEHIAEPIRKLTEGIDRVAGGDYRERVELARNDEFGHMADRFNAMASELQRWESSNLARIMDEKARAEAVIQSLQDASIGLDEQGNVLFANQQALDLLEVAASDIVGRTVSEASRVNDLLRVVLSGERQGPLKIVKDGREQFFTLEHVPIIRSGERMGTVAVLRNVTPFEEKDRAKTHFLATISHELKTPLASTGIGLSLLERQQADRLTPDQAAIIADLRKDHQRLVRIVSELLDLAQVETGNIRVTIAEHALGPLIDDALDAVRRQGEQKDIHFARATSTTNPRIKADAQKAVWVMVNVLNNAVRHSPDHGSITLEIVPEGDQVSLLISDQGPGIPQKDADRLFLRYAPGPGPVHGTGLGLAIAREFMLAMGGNIVHRPASGAGATFILTFAAVPASGERP